MRKAFGASGITLVGQFIVENLILTFLGCIIGIVLAFIILQVINNSALIANMHLTINLTVLFFSLVACLVFGLLSGCMANVEIAGCNRFKSSINNHLQNALYDNAFIQINLEQKEAKRFADYRNVHLVHRYVRCLYIGCFLVQQL